MININVTLDFYTCWSLSYIVVTHVILRFINYFFTDGLFYLIFKRTISLDFRVDLYYYNLYFIFKIIIEYRRF